VTDRRSELRGVAGRRSAALTRRAIDGRTPGAAHTAAPPTRVILAGGFAEMFELCRDAGFELCGYLDPHEVADAGTTTYLGDESNANKILPRFGSVGVVLTPDAPQVRARLHGLFSQAGFESPIVVHPAARISRSARIGDGSVLQSGAYLSSDASIDRFVRLNVDAMVMHDCQVGNYTTIAPRAVLLGRVTVGEGCYVGANSTVLPGVTVGEGCIIGAGAVVTKDVPPNTIVKGNPGRFAVRNDAE